MARQRGARTPRMKRTWGQFVNGTNGRLDTGITATLPAAAAAGSVAFASSLTGANATDYTIGRTFLYGTILMSTSEDVNIGIGMCVVPPGTNTADPITDADWDGWMYHRITHLRTERMQEFADSTIAVHDTANPQVSFRSDVKAMRKVPAGSVIQVTLAVEAAQLIVADVNIDMVFSGRALFLEK